MSESTERLRRHVASYRYLSPHRQNCLDVCDELERLQSRNALLEAALEEIAEESDAGRHDGLPEPCPAIDEYHMWLIAREALAACDEEGR